MLDNFSGFLEAITNDDQDNILELNSDTELSIDNETLQNNFLTEDSILIDVDGDGYSETSSTDIDFDGDGIVDGSYTLSDLNLDGQYDVYGEHSLQDIDGDGLIDTELNQYDLNNDGFMEYREALLDTNGDGTYENISTLTDDDGDQIMDNYSETSYIDTDGDQIIDTVTYMNDFDNDGIIDASSTDLYTDQGDLIDPNISQTMAHYSNVNALHFDPDHNNNDIIGDPSSDMENWHMQTHSDTCAIVSQEYVLEELLDIEFDEDELRSMALDNGWYNDGGGTPLDHVGDLLEAHGLQVDKNYGGTIDDITQCLENGGSVIIGVDADEIWSEGQNHKEDELLEDSVFTPGIDANHAVEVIGIDSTDPDNVMVILNDPGSPDGCGLMVPLDEFQSAWDDSNNYMVTAFK